MSELNRYKVILTAGYYFSKIKVIFVQFADAALWIASLITHPSSKYLFT